ncbi:hypothetical protein P9A10_25535 [Serratia marcescens]|uniref:Uncharacterized protein n=1 Tax=Serratia bockelmannii TaxID=2703793 RepID=A0ABT8LY95_9GAMM|nr:hypothetical protein [Serratia bockelmannii]MDN6881926.1 hypothetical protein [Serratia bockelmannii]HBH6890289.1 hypothetical protein [Serratia marcescens]
MNQYETEPLLGEFTDLTGQRWAFDAESVCYLEEQDGEPYWHLYRYHDLDNPTAESCAALLRVTVSSDGAEGRETK